MKNQFSAIAFLTIGPILRAIYNHPFTLELVDGTLTTERFQYFLRQTGVHLGPFARALALVGAKMRSPEDVSLLLHFSERAIMIERELSGHYFVDYGVAPAAQTSPSCFAYGTHILERAALGTVGEGMAALLPGFWIYREVCDHTRKLAEQGNPYLEWIDSYCNEAQSVVVNQAISLVDRLAGEAGEEERQNMMNAFIASCRYEYYFREDAHALNAWVAV